MSLDPFSGLKVNSLLNRVKSPQFCEPLNLYQKNLKCDKKTCKHEEMNQIILIFRSRWGELHESLINFWPSDFQVKLTVEICSGLRSFQGDGDIADKLHQAFRLPRSCLFPLNNAYVSLDDITTGYKFVISKEEETEKLRPFLKEYDYLFFAQNLDFLTKSCTGGLLFASGQIIVGVLIENAYTFLMDGSYLDTFMDQYITYAEKGYSSQVLKSQDLSTVTSMDGCLFQIGVCESRFGSLRLEVFRETLKQVKKTGTNPLSQRIFKVTIRLYQKYFGSNKDSLVTWTCQCLANLPLGQVLRWYRSNWGSNVEANQFKFFFAKPYYGVVDPGVLVGECKQVDNNEIGILAEQVKGGLIQQYSVCLTNFHMIERFGAVRLNLCRVKKGGATMDYKLMTLNTITLYDLVQIVEPKLDHSSMMVLMPREDVVVPFCMSLNNVQHIYGRPKDDIFSFVLTEKNNSDWTQTKRLEVPRNRFLSDCFYGGDQHFNNCNKKHHLLWHGHIGFGGDIAPFTNMLLYACGTPVYKIFSKETRFLMALEIEQETKEIFIKEFFQNGYKVNIIWAPKVNTIRRMDSARLVENSIARHKILLVTAQDGDNFWFAFLVHLNGITFLHLPQQQTAVEKLLSKDMRHLGQIKALEGLVDIKGIGPFLNIDTLEIIRPIHFKFSEEKPFSKPDVNGVEGLALVMLPSLLPGFFSDLDLLSQFKTNPYIEFYLCPPYIDYYKVRSKCNSSNMFYLRLESEEQTKSIFGKEDRCLIGTSFCIETPDKDLTNHIFFILERPKAIAEICGFVLSTDNQVELRLTILERTFAERRSNQLTTDKESNFKKSNFKKSNVKEANVKEANVKEAKIKETNVKEANVKEANIKEANVNESNVKESNDTKSNDDLKHRLLKILTDAMANQSPRPKSPPTAFSHCVNCAKAINKKTLVCKLCYKGFFCNKKCFNVGKEEHKTECKKIQQLNNQRFLNTL